MINYLFSNLAVATISPGTAPNPIVSLLPLILIFFVFYFMIIKPQKARQKEHENVLKNLKRNDNVVTTGGIHGTVVDMKDTAVVIKVDDNAKILVEKSAIAYVKP
ncbi:MAG: preprotein translocase subunit YajC [Candidatus Omnitrophica bacterium]|nr:preprotein translocase subunit YajC [Candidatus Omnitrophota bacterium]